MSTEIDTEEVKKKITVLRKILLIYQKWLALILKNRPVVILHHTATNRDNTQFSTINYDHYKKKYPTSKKGFNCAYNTLITGNGIAHHARSYNERGEGTGTFQGFHFDICLTGNFDNEPCSSAQLETLENELKTIEQMYGSYILKGHYQYYPTACPGNALKVWIKQRSSK